MSSAATSTITAAAIIKCLITSYGSAEAEIMPLDEDVPSDIRELAPRAHVPHVTLIRNPVLFPTDASVVE